MLTVSLRRTAGEAGEDAADLESWNTVRDQSGATVEAREASGLVKATVSDALGAYRFPSLPPGTREILVRLEGFAPVRRPDVRLALGQLLRVDVALTLGGVQETRGVPRGREHRRLDRREPRPPGPALPAAAGLPAAAQRPSRRAADLLIAFPPRAGAARAASARVHA
jgi:hypothetical protein